MSCLAVVREILHDGAEGNTYLAKAKSLDDIQKGILEISGCESVKVIGEISDIKTAELLSAAFNIDISNIPSFQILFNWKIAFEG